MPFAVVVGDQPVYTLLVEIKSEHPQEYKNIIPFLGPSTSAVKGVVLLKF